MTDRILSIILSIVLWTPCAYSQTNVQNDSIAVADNAAVASLPTDLYASLLIAEPGNDFYSAFGHCAVRLCCPSKKLDFCYTYCLDGSLIDQLALFNGTGKGAYSAVATNSFIKEYIDNGRKVEDYRLNLTPDQVRQLWQILDGELTSGAYRQYNYLHTNCSSMSVFAVERCLGSDEIVWRNLSEGITGTYRTFVRTISEGMPWIRFVWVTLLGHEGESLGTMEHKMGPMLLPPALEASQLRSADGSLRPLLVKGQPQLLNESTIQRSRTWFTPEVLFILLLVLAAVTAVLELRGKAGKWVRTFHALMLTAQTFLGLVIVYITVISDMTGASLNLNLLIFNPVPAVMWLVARRRAWYVHVWTVYTAALCLYIVMWFVTPQVDFTHVLMALPLLTITASKMLILKKTTQKQ
jgi:hypothetical protein